MPFPPLQQTCQRDSTSHSVRAFRDGASHLLPVPEKGEGGEERTGEGREGPEGWGMTQARLAYASPRGKVQVEPLYGSHRTSSWTPGPICRALNFLPTPKDSSLTPQNVHSCGALYDSAGEEDALARQF